MRVLVIVVCVLIVTYLGIILGAEGSNIQFSLSGATSTTYNKFLSDLRGQLKNDSVYNIPRLKSAVSNSQRFILVDLTDTARQTVTMGIDVLNVYVLGYSVSAASCSILRQDDQKVPIDDLFPTKCTELRYTGNYIALEKAANQRRENIPLGPEPLNNAIISLGKGTDQSVARSLIIIIQMVSEAARFKRIANLVSDSISNHNTFKPGFAMLSLENNWSSLSKEIQSSIGGKFVRPVELTDDNNKPYPVNSIDSPVMGSLALLLYQSNTTKALASQPDIIGMHHVVLDNYDDLRPVRDRRFWLPIY